MEYGVHINGIVQASRTDEPKMWIARRSATKSNWPNMLDHIVAGGQPAGISLLENVVKECEEEAGIEESIVRAGVQAAERDAERELVHGAVAVRTRLVPLPCRP